MYPKCEQVTQMNSLASLIVPQACKHFINPQVSTHLGSNWPILLDLPRHCHACHEVTVT